MRLLLDTHVLLWQLSGTRALGAVTRQHLAIADELLFSSVSYAEIGIKVAVGKLTVPADLRDRILAVGVRTLGLTPEHGLRVAELPVHHRDPFDRLLVAQALIEDLTLVTADERLHDYDVAVLDPVR